MSAPPPTPTLVEVSMAALEPARSDLEFQLHESALAWRLVEPIVIDSEDDIKSVQRWGNRLKPFAHQIENLFLFCRRLPVTLIADEVGLGKTISAGLVLAELMERRRVRRTLVLAPKVLGPQWKEELESKFAIEALPVSGADFDEAVAGHAPVVITTYETIRTRAAALQSRVFDMLILDEAHKLRNLYPDEPPQMASTVRTCLANGLFKFVLMLTATPMQNRLWDLYSLVDCLAVARGLHNPFGNATTFSATYCADPDGRRLKQSAAPRLRSILQEFVCRTRRADARLTFPTRNVHLAASPPSPAEKELLELIAPLLAELNPLAATSVLKAYVSSPVALAQQLEHMCANDRPHWRAIVDRAKELAADPLASSKVQQLLRLIERLRAERPRDWRVLVFTERLETQALIIRELASRGIEVGSIRGGQPALNQQAIAGLRSDPPAHHVVVSTDSGAEGVNLQSANVLVNVDLPWNPMRLEQRIGRVQRLGSAHATVEIVNLVLQGTFDERVLALLMTKLQTVAQSLGEIESILESLDDEDGDGFEERVLELVRRSLAGKDVQAALQKEVASIEEAQRRIKDEGELVDRTLGDLRHLHRTGARPPDLARSKPSLPLPQFVEEALRARGAQVKGTGNGALEVTEQGTMRIYALEPSVAGDVPMYPGSAEFDRLVDAWSSRAAMRLRQVKPSESADVAASRWLSAIPGASLVRAEPESASGRFDGCITALATAANAFDRYEKLVVCAAPALAPLPDSERVAPLEVSESPFERGLSQERFGAGVRQLVEDGVARDADINAFVRFYTQRGEEEAARPEAIQPQRLRDDHRSSLRAEIASVSGRLCERTKVRASVSLDGADYEVELFLDALRAAVRCEEPLAQCSCSKRTVPQRWLETSSVSGVQALSHLFERCQATNDLALPEELAESEISGKRVRSDQLATSSTSGKKGHVSEFERSPLSGRPAERDAFEKSQDSGRLGLPDEMRVCVWTGRRVLADEIAACAVTGAPVAKSALDVRGIVREASELMARQAGSPAPQVMTMLATLDPERFARADQIVTVRAASGTAIAALIRLKGFLGIGTRYVVALLASADVPTVEGCWLSKNLTSAELVA